MGRRGWGGEGIGKRSKKCNNLLKFGLNVQHTLKTHIFNSNVKHRRCRISH